MTIMMKITIIAKRKANNNKKQQIQNIFKNNTN